MATGWVARGRTAGVAPCPGSGGPAVAARRAAVARSSLARELAQQRGDPSVRPRSPSASSPCAAAPAGQAEVERTALARACADAVHAEASSPATAARIASTEAGARSRNEAARCGAKEADPCLRSSASRPAPRLVPAARPPPTRRWLTRQGVNRRLVHARTRARPGPPGRPRGTGGGVHRRSTVSELRASTGLVRKSSMPAARHRSRSPSNAAGGHRDDRHAAGRRAPAAGCRGWRRIRPCGHLQSIRIASYAPPDASSTATAPSSASPRRSRASSTPWATIWLTSLSSTTSRCCRRRRRRFGACRDEGSAPSRRRQSTQPLNSTGLLSGFADHLMPDPAALPCRPGRR